MGGIQPLWGPPALILSAMNSTALSAAGTDRDENAPDTPGLTPTPLSPPRLERDTGPLMA